MNDSIEVKPCAELAPIVQVEGARFTETGVLLDSTDEQTLRRASGFVMRLRKALDWCTGDMADGWLKFITQRDKADGIKARDDRHARQMELEHIGAYADTYGARRDVILDRQTIAHFFPHHLRRVELSFEHHAEAYIEAKGDLLAADKLLAVAAENKWSVFELRAHIRKNNARIDDDEGGPLDLGEDPRIGETQLWVARRIRWARDMEPATARLMLESIKPLVETLTRRANAA